jgi:hypothetical protein
MWTRAVAGIVPGFFLAAALVGLASWLWPGSWESTMVVTLLVFFPVWTGIFCISFRFQNGKLAWLWLGGMALIALGLLYLLKLVNWVR